MKYRIDASGLHFYDRKSGTHILFDEVQPQPTNYSIAPRTVSVAITDACDFHCGHCHVKKGHNYMRLEQVLSLGMEFDKLGTLDFALGGGEPTLHPDLDKICSALWNQTSLGVSLTTHGHNLTPGLVNSLQGHVSFIRISIDGVEPIYSQMRGRPLSDLEDRMIFLEGRIPFGINVVVNSQTIDCLDELLQLALGHGAIELLILPMIRQNSFVLSKSEWAMLDSWIKTNYKSIALRVLSTARPHLTGPYLFNDPNWDNDYAYIGTDMTLRNSSYIESGIPIQSFSTIEELLHHWRNQKAYTSEQEA